jgi:hypothetical protein
MQLLLETEPMYLLLPYPTQLGQQQQAKPFVVVSF